MRRRLWVVAFVVLATYAVAITVLHLSAEYPSGPSILSVSRGGTLAEWLAAIGTVSALFATIWSSRRSLASALEALDQTRTQVRVAEAEAERANWDRLAHQAIAVAAWIDASEASGRADDRSISLEVERAERVIEGLLASHLANLVAVGLRARSDRRPLTAAEFEGLPAHVRSEVDDSYQSLMSEAARYGASGPKGAFVTVVVVHNRSAVPVYDFSLKLDRGDGATEEVLSLPVLAPRDEPTSFLLPREAGKGGHLVSEVDANACLRTWRLQMSFRDAAGRHWERDFAGQLSTDIATPGRNTDSSARQSHS